MKDVTLKQRELARLHVHNNVLEYQIPIGQAAEVLGEKGCPRGRIPKGLSPWGRMERKLLTKRGRALYKKRGVLVEPVFRTGQGRTGVPTVYETGGWALHRVSGSLAGMTHKLAQAMAQWPSPKGLGQGTMELRE